MDDINKPTTEVLQKKLFEATNINHFMDHNTPNLSHERFSDLLMVYLEEKSLKNSEALKRSQMSESYGYQLLNGSRQPSRDKVIQLALGIGLDLNKTNRLLRLAEKSELYVKTKRDAIIMFAINQKWSLSQTEELLIEKSFEPIVKSR